MDVDDLSGKVEFAIPGMLSIPTPNLTPGAGGLGSFYTDEYWVRAIHFHPPETRQTAGCPGIRAVTPHSDSL